VRHNIAALAEAERTAAAQLKKLASTKLAKPAGLEVRQRALMW